MDKVQVSALKNFYCDVIAVITTAIVVITTAIAVISANKS